MPFQFQCPSGHLLEADDSQVGQQSQCPMCGQTFAIPSPAGEAAAFTPEASPFPFNPGSAEPAGEAAPFVLSNPDGPADANELFSGPKELHIPCPNGHELEVPPEMIGQDVMCPHCHVQFLLREKDSIEAKRRREEQQELKDYKAGKTWLMWAVIIGVLVLIGLAIMIGVTAST